MKARAKVNANIRTLAGRDVSAPSSVQGQGSIYSDPKYETYRRLWKECPENFMVPFFPLFLDLEATSMCNLKCPYCVQTIDPNFVRGFMEWDLYARIIDEAADHGCFGVKYHTIGRGEPLLHKKLPEMVAYAKGKGMVDVYVNTNATLLTPELSRKLLDAGLDRISFSIDGYSKEFYEKNRVGANFADVLKNVTKFWLLREENNYPTRIRIQTVELPGLDLGKYASMWGPICDEVAVIAYKEMSHQVYGLKGEGWACPQLWQRMSVLFDGTILPCNHLDREKFHTFGNVKEKRLFDVWHGEEMTYMRDRHMEGGSHLVGACDGCSLRTTELSLLGLV